MSQPLPVEADASSETLGTSADVFTLSTASASGSLSKKNASPAVKRVRWLSYAAAAQPRWRAFLASGPRVHVKPLLENADVAKYIGVLHRHGKDRAEDALPLPVELMLEILSYCPAMPAEGLRYGEAARGSLPRAMLAHSALYFLVMENDAVKSAR